MWCCETSVLQCEHAAESGALSLERPALLGIFGGGAARVGSVAFWSGEGEGAGVRAEGY